MNDNNADTSDDDLGDRNLVGGRLERCNHPDDPSARLTGFYRDGYCRTGPDDTGRHVVCAEVTESFLRFTARRGNDLSTPRRPWFPGLRPGDRWCLCALRWLEAHDHGQGPPIVANASHERALDLVPSEPLLANDVHAAPTQQ